MTNYARSVLSGYGEPWHGRIVDGAACLKWRLFSAKLTKRTCSKQKKKKKKKKQKKKKKERESAWALVPSA